MKEIVYNIIWMGTESPRHPPKKDIGVIIDSKLKFQDHINTQVKKANTILGIIKRSFSYIDQERLLILYKSLVRPHLEYASTAWTTTNKK